MSRRSQRVLASLCAAALVASSSVSSAVAQESAGPTAAVAADVAPGPLSITPGQLRLGSERGGNQSFVQTATVLDATGSGDGWHVSLSVSVPPTASPTPDGCHDDDEHASDDCSDQLTGESSGGQFFITGLFSLLDTVFGTQSSGPAAAPASSVPTPTPNAAVSGPLATPPLAGDQHQSCDAGEDAQDGCTKPTPVPDASRPSVLITGASQQALTGVPAAPTGAVIYPVALTAGAAPAVVYDTAANAGLGKTELTFTGFFAKRAYAYEEAPVFTFTIASGPQ